MAHMYTTLLDSAAPVRGAHVLNDLHRAILKCSLPDVKKALKAGTDVNSLNLHLESALAVACRYPVPSIIRLLIKRGATFDGVPGTLHAAPIFTALASHDEIEPLEILISAGADVNVRTEQTGTTPLHRAAYKDSPTACILLLDAGAHVDARNAAQETPLIVAISNYAKNTPAILMSRGANVNAVDARGRTVLMAALRHYASGGMLRSLMVCGADAYCFPASDNVFDNESGALALEVVGVDAAHWYWDRAEAKEWREEQAKHAMLQQFLADPSSRSLRVWPFMENFDEMQNRFNAHWLQLRSDFNARVLTERQVFGKKRFEFIRQRAATICMSLFMLRLPALVSVRIIEESFLYTDCIPWHCLWDLAVAVRHFHDKKKKKE